MKLRILSNKRSNFYYSFRTHIHWGHIDKGYGMYKLKINGELKTVEAEEGTPMLWVIRDEVGLTGTKFGCGVSSCGACTIHVDGKPMRSCQLTVEDATDKDIQTIEGITGPIAKAVQTAWKDLDVVQCGYCQSGQIMQSISLLSENRKPSDEDINEYMGGNVCRCATYQRIRAAIHLAASKLEA